MSEVQSAMAVSVIISAIDRLTSPTRLMAAQMSRLRSETNMTEQQLARLESRMKNFRNMTLVGAGVTLAGAGLAKGLLDSVDAAGRLQTSMLNVQAAMKLNNAELQKATKLSQTVGIPTMWSSEQMGTIMQTMANSGLSKSQVLNPQTLKQYASFAEVQYRSHGTDPKESVEAAVQMAHMYQVYSSKQLTPFLNQANAVLLHTTLTPTEFATQFKYLAGQSKSMGMSSQQALATTAWLDRIGLHNSGRIFSSDFLMRTIYGATSKKASAAMQAAGFVKDGRSVFTTANGNFVGIPEAVKILQDFNKRMGYNSNKTSGLLYNIFGLQGMRVAKQMMGSGSLDQYYNIQKQMSGTASIQATQEAYNKSWEGQVTQFKTTMQDLQQVFGQSLMKGMLPALTAINKFTSKLLIFAQAHPTIVKYIATFASIAAAIMLVVGPLMVLVGAFGFITKSGIIVSTLRSIGSSFIGMLGPVATLAATSYILYQAWTHDWGGIQEKTKSVLDWLKSEFKKAQSWINPVLKTLGFEQTSTVTEKKHVQGGWMMGATKQVTSFKMPDWAKWGAGALTAFKAIQLLISTTMKMVTVSKTMGTAMLAMSKNVITTAISFGKLTASVILSTARFIANAASTIAVKTAQVAVAVATKAWAAIQWVLNAAMDANPIGLITLAISGLIVVVIAIVKHWNDFSSALSNVFGWLGKVWSAISKFTSGAVKTVMGWFGMGGNINLAGAAPSSSTTVHVHPGAIQVNGSSNPKATANEVMKQLGTKTRSANMSQALSANPLHFGG